MRFLLLLLSVWTVLVVGENTSHAADQPSREILGLHLGMKHEDAVARLKEIGKFEREERKRQEIWTVRDERYSHIIISTTKDGHLRFITAVAPEAEKPGRLRYADIGDLEKAKQVGDPSINNFHYQWTLEPTEDEPETQVSVRGRDPEFLWIHALKRIEDNEEAEEEDD